MAIDDMMEFIEQNKLIIWRAQGTIDANMVLNYYKKLKECPWGYKADRFCDFSGAEKFELDYKGLSALRDYRVSYLHNHVGVKLVMYSRLPLGYAMSRMYQTLMEGKGIEILVTKELQEAAAFLGIELDLIDSKPSPVESP